MAQDRSRSATRMLFFAAVFFSFFFNLGSVSLFDVDEGAFSEATREMFARGDFMSTYLNGAPRYDKPILIYWLQAVSVAVFGVHEFAFRLPSALAATGWMALIVLFVRRFRDERTAYIAGIIAATGLSISIIAKSATADALLNLFIAASMFGVYLFYQEQRRIYIYGVFVLMGLGFLTKGPVAVLIPLAVSLIFFGIKGQWRAWRRAAFDPVGIALFLVVALPWYIVEYHREGPAFLHGFFFKHNIGRFSGPMEGHAGSLLYYLPVILIGLMPFTSLLLKTISKARIMWRDDLQLYLLIWFLFVFVFFSLSGTKLPHYTNYGLTGVVILMAIYFAELRSAFWALLPPLAFFVLLLFLPEIIQMALPGIRDAFYFESLRHYRDYFAPLYRVFFFAAVAFTVYFMVERKQALQIKLLISGLMTVFALSAFVLPAFSGMVQAPVKAAGLLAGEQGYRVVQWRVNMPSFSVYSQRATVRRQPRPGDVVLTTPGYLSGLGAYKLLFLQNGVALARLTGGADREQPPQARRGQDQRAERDD